MKMRTIQVMCIICLFFVLHGSIFAEDRVIRGVTEPWEPYMGSGLKNQGFLPELMMKIFERTGYKTKVQFVPWKRAVFMVKQGRADVLLGAYYTKERGEFIEYPKEVGLVQDVLFSRIGKNITYKNLIELKAYRIGVVRGAAHGREFDEANYLIKEDVTNREMNIKKLMAGRIDLMAGPRDVTLFIIRTKYPQYVDKIEEVYPPLSGNKLYLAFSKNVPGYEKTVSAFTEGLRMIKKDGTFDKIAEKHGIGK